MRHYEIAGAMNSGNLPRAMMLFGESTFMIDYWISQLARFYAPQDEACRLYFQEYNFSAAKAHLSQGSLFGGSNLLIVKSEKKVAKKELDELVEMTQKAPDNFFIYAYYGTDYKTSNKSFTKKNVTENVRFFAPSFKDAMGLLQQECQRLGIKVDQYVLAHLYNSQNGDIALSVNELSKLSIIDRPIETKDIDALVYSLAEVKLDDIIADLLSKKDFRKDLSTLLESGEEPIKIITNISGFVSQLFMFVAHMKLEGNASSQAVLGYRLPPHLEKQRADQAKKFSLGTYTKMLQLLLECEYEIKSPGSHDKQALLFATLLKLQSLI